MAPELSSNWKKLQAKIKAEPSKPSVKKRKSIETDDDDYPNGAGLTSKRRKQNTTLKRQQKRPQPPARSKRSEPPIPKKAMGATQSQPAAPKSGLTPHASLWTPEPSDPTVEATESLAQAYSLGVQSNSLLTDPLPHTPTSTDVVPGKYIAIDCEMVGVGEGGYTSALARVSLVDFHGRQLYDVYVRPAERVTDWRTKVSGILPRHVLGAGAVDFATAQATVAGLMKGRVLVGHDVKHDLAALEINHPPSLVRDTARHSGFKGYGHGPKPALRVLAREVLGLEIQKGSHSSLEDARTAMLLYRKDKGAFDVEHAARYPDTRQVAVRSKGGKGKKKKTR